MDDSGWDPERCLGVSRGTKEMMGSREERKHIPQREEQRQRHGGLNCHAGSEVKLLSRVPLFAISWTVAYQAPPSMGFSRQ